MKTIYDIYEEFSKCLLQDRIFEDPRVSYGELCAFLGVKEEELDALLFGELGESGERILKEFRGQICD